nr:hypothetical protein [uncultured Methanospirillum sp.]
MFNIKGKRLIIAFAFCLIFGFATAEVAAGITFLSTDEYLALHLKDIGNAIGNEYSQGESSTPPNTNTPAQATESDLAILLAAHLASNEVKELPLEGSGMDTYRFEGWEATTPTPTITQSLITIPPSDPLLALLKVEMAEMPGGKSCTGGPDCYENSGDMSGSTVAQPITDAPPRHGW